MASVSYRWSGQPVWHSQSGNAILALANKVGSGKRLIVRRLFLTPQRRGEAASATRFAFARVAVAGGDSIPLAACDSTATLPSGIRVVRDASAGTPTGADILRRMVLWPSGSSTGQTLVALNGPVNRLSALVRRRDDAGVEAIQVRPGEAIAVVLDDSATNDSLLATWHLQISVGGKTWTAVYDALLYGDGATPMAVVNDSVSDVVKITMFGLVELGGTDTPYFQIVNGLIDGGSVDSAGEHAVTPVRVDSADTAWDNAKAVLRLDAPILPQSPLPQAYFSDASAGQPKGLNYLQTKDFIGPTMGNVFPEITNANAPGGGTRAGDLCGGTRCHRRNDLLFGRGPIVVNEGETLAVVSAAEQAITGTPGKSSAVPCDVAIEVEVADVGVPTVTLTGVEDGSVVMIVDTGTDTVLTNATVGPSGVFTWEHDLVGTAVDVRVLKPGFRWYEVANLTLTSANGISVVQETDIVYQAASAPTITFNAATTRIIADTGTVSLDMRAVYSAWIDWAATGTNLRYARAFRTVGGDTTVGANSVSVYYFMQNGWRIRPQEASHELAIAGFVTVDGGGNPIVATLGAYNVQVRYDLPVKAEAVSTSGGSGPDAATIAAAVWSYISRTLTSGGSITAADVWAHATRTLTASGDPTASAIATAVRSELATELARLDAAMSTRATPADVAAGAAAVNVESINGAEVIGTGTTGDAWRGVGVAP